MSEAEDRREKELRDALRRRHPGLREALVADARVACAYRGEEADVSTRLAAAWTILRLAWVSDAFLPQALYRLKAALQARGVPLLPRIAHRLAMMTGGVAIGDPVLVHPGVYLVHGHVVIDGLTEVGRGAVIAPFVTIGLRGGELVGPTIGPNVIVGTGAKVLGRVSVGRDARIGANAVVVGDVDAKSTVVGAPARPVAGAGA